MLLTATEADEADAGVGAAADIGEEAATVEAATVEASADCEFARRSAAAVGDEGDCVDRRGMQQHTGGRTAEH